MDGFKNRHMSKGYAHVSTVCIQAGALFPFECSLWYFLCIFYK